MRKRKNPENHGPDTRNMRSHFGILGAVVSMILFAFFIQSCTKEEDKELIETDLLKAAGIDHISPINQADSVPVNPLIEVTFSSELTESEVSASTITLKDGSTLIQGAMAIVGTKMTFEPGDDLTQDHDYNVIVRTGFNASGTKLAREYYWRFRTGRHRRSVPPVADVVAPTITSVTPANSATAIALSTPVKVTFNEPMNSSTINSSTVGIKQGSTVVTGTVSYAGAIATFTPAAPLIANTVYTGTVSTAAKDVAGNAIAAVYTWSFTTLGTTADVTAPTVTTVVPANSATNIATNSTINATFSEAMNASTITTSSFTLKQGATVVAGTVSYTGTTAKFTPSAALTAGLVYTASITQTVKDVAGNALAAIYTWSFTTLASTGDVTAPTVTAVVPANSATSIATNSTVNATFSEAMNASTITATSFTLKQGTTAVSGTVSYTGTTAKFTPSAALSAGLVYTASITTTVKDVAGNSLAAVYTWSFTTLAVVADVTPPTVTTVVPANSATSIATNSTVNATFSEAMNASTITAASFTLKQGTTAVNGTVSYTGTTAKFTPSAALPGGLVYTASITQTVKDVAGNSLAAVYTWSFTTVASVPAGKSFSADVMPVLGLCNNCHTHPWTTSTNASTFYSNLVSGGFVNPTSYTSSKIYNKISGSHGSSVGAANITNILTWMTEGSKNN